MSLAKAVLITAGLVMGSAVAAHAQAGNERSGYIVLTDPGGVVRTMELTTTGTTMAMKGARRLPRGTMIVHVGNSFYAMQDKRMSDGRMMSEWIADRAKGYIR